MSKRGKQRRKLRRQVRKVSHNADVDSNSNLEPADDIANLAEAEPSAAEDVVAQAVAVPRKRKPLDPKQAHLRELGKVAAAHAKSLVKMSNNPGSYAQRSRGNAKSPHGGTKIYGRMVKRLKDARHGQLMLGLGAHQNLGVFKVGAVRHNTV